MKRDLGCTKWEVESSALAGLWRPLPLARSEQKGGKALIRRRLISTLPIMRLGGLAFAFQACLASGAAPFPHFSSELSATVQTTSTQAKMDVLVNGQKQGTATLGQKIGDNGAKIVTLGMAVSSDTGDVTVHSQSNYDNKGAPTRMYQETITGGKVHSRKVVIATFDSDGANIVVDLNGDRSTKHIAAPADTPREDASEFWFVRDQPSVGLAETALRFNLDSLTWDKITTTFKGVRPITVNGRRVIANVTQSEEGTAFLDDQGLPYRLELPNATMERNWEK